MFEDLESNKQIENIGFVGSNRKSKPNVAGGELCEMLGKSTNHKHINISNMPRNTFGNSVGDQKKS